MRQVEISPGFNNFQRGRPGIQWGTFHACCTNFKKKNTQNLPPCSGRSKTGQASVQSSPRIANRSSSPKTFPSATLFLKLQISIRKASVPVQTKMLKKQDFILQGKIKTGEESTSKSICSKRSRTSATKNRRRNSPRRQHRSQATHQYAPAANQTIASLSSLPPSLSYVSPPRGRSQNKRPDAVNHRFQSTDSLDGFLLLLQSSKYLPDNNLLYCSPALLPRNSVRPKNQNQKIYKEKKKKEKKLRERFRMTGEPTGLPNVNNARRRDQKLQLFTGAPLAISLPGLAWLTPLFNVLLRRKLN